jgi:hypothetical protein
VLGIPTPLVTPKHEDPRPVLATLEILNAGPTKGAVISLRSALGHVGRGGHNDVRLSDESVSETHAKLQRRDDGWYLVDMDSTNGTYVAGVRVKGERHLDGPSELRFGGMKLRFVPAGAVSAAELEGKSTRPIATVERKRAPVADRVEAPVRTDVPKGGISVWVWIVVALVALAAAFFVLKGRA